MKAGILAAGDGSRLQRISPFKPLVKVGDKALFERAIAYLSPANPEKIFVIFNDKERDMDFSQLPSLQSVQVSHFFKSTLSSMHSLYEVMKKAEMTQGEHLFVMMVDSIIRPEDFALYMDHCKKLPASQSSVLITNFVEDEKPLTVRRHEDGTVEAFQVPAADGVPITSGVYCFSADIVPLLEDCVARHEKKMRNFLKSLVAQGHVINTFLVDKTLDVDRPEDIESAEEFLRIGAKNDG